MRVAMTERMTTMGGISSVLNYTASRGLDPNELCDCVGLDTALFGDPLRMIPFSLARRVWCTAIERLPNDNVGVGVGTTIRMESFGYAGMFLTQVKNGLELLQLTIDAAPITDTALVVDPITLRQDAGRVEVRFPPILSDGIPERNEAAFLGVLTLLRRLGLSELRPREVRASCARSDKRAEAERHYGCKIRWSAGEDVICYARDALLAPVSGGNPRAADQFRALVAARVGRRREPSFAERVRQLVRQQVLRGEVSQNRAALALGMSVRSLQRKLSESGLSYGQEVEKALERRARELMRNGQNSLEDIALKLGYSELSSFSRFWKKLTGQTPARYRAELLGLRVGS
jgi:AraC-like DNA-binding protein